MVLASIAIHGLSIPFFSLSKRVHSVSRTWSRHDTWTRHDTLGRRHAVPEWASGIPVVTRGAADIVINRDHDHDVEKGISPVDDEKTMYGGVSRRESTTVQDSSTDAEKDSGSNTSQAQTPDTRTVDIREEVPPDGIETLQEWREGDHRIIEKRGGPGEEVHFIGSPVHIMIVLIICSVVQVEVEVQKNAYGPKDTDVSIVHVAEHAAHDAIDEIRHKLSQGEAKIGEVLNHLGASVVGSPQQEPQNQDEEEEGWMSDRSATEGTNAEGQSSPSRRGKSPKSHRTPKLNITTGRRRHSFRRGVLSPRHFSASPQTTDDTTETGIHTSSRPPSPNSEPLSSQADDETRGRTMTHGHQPLESSSGSSSLKSPGIASRRSLRNSRLESLRSLPGSRDLSPARSVRWADGHSPSASRPGSAHGTVTPRAIRSPNSSIPGTPVIGSEDEGDGGPSVVPRGGEVATTASETKDGQGVAEKDSPQSMVRFELPPPVQHGGRS